MRLAALFTLALGALAGATPAYAQPGQGEPYKIGIILPMTGSTADYGTDFKRGAELGEEEINAKGGINGRPIKLEDGDSKQSPKDAAAEFKRLDDVERLPAIISTMTGVII